MGTPPVGNNLCTLLTAVSTGAKSQGHCPKSNCSETTEAKAKCCFTSTETVGLLGTGAQDGHLDFHTAHELCFTSTETVGLLGTGAQDGHLDFHTAHELCFTSTETVGLLGTGAQDGHLDFHTAHELCFTSTETVGLLGTGAQDGHLDFHTAPEPWSKGLSNSTYESPAPPPYSWSHPELSIESACTVCLKSNTLWRESNQWSHLSVDPSQGNARCCCLYAVNHQGEICVNTAEFRSCVKVEVAVLGFPS